MTEARSRILFPLVLSGGLLGLYAFLEQQAVRTPRYEAFGENVFGAGHRWLLFLALVPLIVVTVRAVDALAFDIALSRRKSVAAPRLLRDMVALVLYFLLFSWATSTLFQYRLTNLLTATTVVAAVVGLALQETLGNLFSGIALHLEDTFEVGDVIKSGEFMGVVEGLNWRATRIRAFAGNNVVVLPNSVLARERLEVFPRRNLNARVLQVSVDGETTPADAMPLLTEAASNIEGVSQEMPCFARVQSFGRSSITYEIKYFTREYEHRDRIDADVRKAIWYALRGKASTDRQPQ